MIKLKELRSILPFEAKIINDKKENKYRSK